MCGLGVMGQHHCTSLFCLLVHACHDDRMAGGRCLSLSCQATAGPVNLARCPVKTCLTEVMFHDDLCRAPI